jgi:hypothetical protein
MSLPLPLREGVGGGGHATSPTPSPNPLPQGEGDDFGPTDAELRVLLIDCVALWDVEPRVVVGAEGIEIASNAGTFLLQRAPRDMRPIRWLLHTPERRAANRPPRAAPSIGAALTALRNALGAETGNKLRIGATA